MPDHLDMAESLTPSEDEQLRRLAALAEFGELTLDSQAVFHELRSRDRREEIRQPRVLAIPLPRVPRDAGAFISD